MSKKVLSNVDDVLENVKALWSKSQRPFANVFRNSQNYLAVIGGAEGGRGITFIFKRTEGGFIEANEEKWECAKENRDLACMYLY